jgi:hypothetical protein
MEARELKPGSKKLFSMAINDSLSKIRRLDIIRRGYDLTSVLYKCFKSKWWPENSNFQSFITNQYGFFSKTWKLHPWHWSLTGSSITKNCAPCPLRHKTGLQRPENWTFRRRKWTSAGNVQREPFLSWADAHQHFLQLNGWPTSMAQLVAFPTWNPKVPGSNPG